MATKRRKNHVPKIKVWTSRHTHLLNAVARMNVITKENAKKVTSVAGKMMSENAFKDMVDLGYIKIETVEYKGKINELVTIGSKGERKLRDISSPTTKHKYNSSSDPHDLEHSNFIFEVFSIEEIQNNYRSEKELDVIGSDTSVTDGAFIYDDERENIYIETVTQYYTKEQKKSHRNYAKKSNGRYIENTVRIPRKSL